MNKRLNRSNSAEAWGEGRERGERERAEKKKNKEGANKQTKKAVRQGLFGGRVEKGGKKAPLSQQTK